MMKRPRQLLVLFVSLAISLPSLAMTPEERRAYLNKFVETMPVVASFNTWLQRAGELPPDYDALPKINSLPDPLRFVDGRPVKSANDWKARRAEIDALEQKYDLGTFPPRPGLDNVVVIDETTTNGQITRNLRFEFGPDRKATLRATITIPAGSGPFPVMISPSISNGAAGFGGAALQRGYISAGFAGNDSQNDANAYVPLYPDFDFADLPRRAWSSQVLTDYLYTLPQVDKAHIAINGYSRDGKMALIAAAIDPRITAVIPGSTGVGGVMPWRLGSERGFGESIESTTRNFPTWFVPRLRFFSGREDRLPVDGNLLVALVAPRAVLITYGNNDEVSQPWPMEQAYRSALRAYDLLGKPEALGVMHSPGYHGANDVQAAMDWLDFQFGRSQTRWTNDLIYPWDYDQWRTQVKNTVDLSKYPARKLSDTLKGSNGRDIVSVADWEKKSADIRKAVEWMLGDKTPGSLARPFPLPKLGDPSQPARGARGGGGARGGAARGAAAQTNATLFDDIHGSKANGNSYGWNSAAAPRAAKRKITFSSPSGFGAIEADLFTPTDAAGARLPAVIWLHGYSSSLGYSWVYHYDVHPVLALVQAGYAVLAFDQSGFGSRQVEAAAFYNRYPRWSQMGHMVDDTRAAIDALSKEAAVDSTRIYLFGYSMGANIALHTAALDPRVKGVVSLNGFTPMRADTEDKGTSGIARYFREHDLLPRMGAFAGKETQLPYDYDELIAAIAPRPVYVLSAQFDRDATPADVKLAVEQAKKIYALYNAADNVMLDQPWDYNRLPLGTQERAIQWMLEKMK
ncbi:MAG TPA: alpha/beta fold hydrolase [Terriglobia bacterium]|nr:alpha/beta fold hydrolase [Terriglobia bacterium]